MRWTFKMPWNFGEAVSPACAGMDPGRPRRPSPRRGFPRMRGDGPSICEVARLLGGPVGFPREGFPRMRGDGPVTFQVTGQHDAFPPHARGWTHGRVGL